MPSIMLQGIMLSKISQKGKSKYCMVSLISGMLKKKKKKKTELREAERRIVVIRGLQVGDGRGGRKGERWWSKDTKLQLCGMKKSRD